MADADVDSSIARSLRILSLLAAADGPVTHGELHRASELPKSTLTVRLRELRRLGYVLSADGRYTIGPALFSLGHDVSQRMTSGLRHPEFRPVIERLARDTGESVALVIEIGGHGDVPGTALAIDTVHGTNPVRFVGDFGLPIPMYRSAAGRALLAFSNRSASKLPPESLVKATPKTKIDPSEIDVELEHARARGYALSIEEYWEGVVSIAAPITLPGTSPMLVISITGLLHRMMPPETSIWPPLRDAIAGAQAEIRKASGPATGDDLPG
jgi:DNA-binding IclR family transcriptional regulator